MNLDPYSKKEVSQLLLARAEQEKLRKEIEHVRTLKGQTEISQRLRWWSSWSRVFVAPSPWRWSFYRAPSHSDSWWTFH